MDASINVKNVSREGLLFVFSLLIIYTFCPGCNWVILISASTYLIAEIISTIFQNKFAKTFFNLTSDKKSVVGLAAFFCVNILILSSLPYLIGIYIGQTAIYFNIVLLAAVLSISVIVTFFKAISSRGFDKFIIPIVTAIMVFIFFNSLNPVLVLDFIFGLAIAGGIAFISYKVRFLTANGSVATFLLAGFIFGLGGLKWSVPMMVFFILSSLLSKVRKKQNEKVEQYFEKTGVRDYMQVLANGGIGGILVILNQLMPNEIFFIIYVAALAAVCADTWATEIGTMVQTDTYNIINLKPVEQGISGGISIIGTLGAFLGALTIGVSGIFWIELNIIQYLIIVILAGVMGSLFDSYLGATIQSQNQCRVCAKITERDFHCGEKADHMRGYKWINNDMVNLFSGLFGGLFIIIVYGIL